MARPAIQTLEFLQFEPGLFDDLKIIRLNEKYGPLGEGIYIRALSLIATSEGYWATYDDAFVLAILRKMGKWGKNMSFVDTVIRYCAACGLFHSGLLAQGVITAPGIQRRWLRAKRSARARGLTYDKYWLLSQNETLQILGLPHDSPDYCNNNPDYCSNNPDYCSNNSADNIQDEEVSISDRADAHARGEAQAPMRKPTVDEIRAYCVKYGLTQVDPQRFYDYNEARGWVTAKGVPIRSWQALIRAWDEFDISKGIHEALAEALGPNPFSAAPQRQYPEGCLNSLMNHIDDVDF